MLKRAAAKLDQRLDYLGHDCLRRNVRQGGGTAIPAKRE
jgi:hypothetical protein